MKIHNKKLKVLIVGYLPPPQEGTARITEVIVNSQYLRDNFEIIFLSLKKRNKATLRGKMALMNVFYNLLNFIRYKCEIIFYQPNIIYLPLAQNRLGFLRDSFFILIGKFFGKKICVHFHGGNFDLFYQQQKIFFQRYIRYVLKKIDRLILLAEKFKKQFNQFIDESKMSVLYNCLPEMQIDFHERTNSVKDKIRVLFIGYLSKAKGALDLVYSIPKVLAVYKNPIEFILCGQPVDIERNITFISEPHLGYSKIKKFIEENNLQAHVRIFTNLTSEQKEKFFWESDIFVFPTYSEGCGLVVLEAMAYGLTIITTRVGALEEMLKEGENCFFVKPGDCEELAEKILFLANNEELRKKFGENNKKLIGERYNKNIFVKNLMDIWISIT